MSRFISLFLFATLSFLLSSVIFTSSESNIPSDLFYCVDWDCQDFISRGKTLLNYAGRTDKHLSFRQNEDIRILSKPVDDNGPDWVGMVRRKVGLVPKTMVREDQMGKHPSKFKYPLNLLPLWTASDSNPNEEPAPTVPSPNDEAEYGADDNVEQVSSEEIDDQEKDNSTSDSKDDSVPPVSQPQVTSDGTVMPDDFDGNGQQKSVEPAVDVSEPAQTTVMSDELQKQEHIEPTETVDHEVPEIPEATAVSEGKSDADHPEVIEPTKSSTLDQLMTTATEVVVEPSEIVDLKDPQDILESPQVSNEPISEGRDEGNAAANPDSGSPYEEVTESPSETVTERPVEPESQSTPDLEAGKEELKLAAEAELQSNTNEGSEQSPGHDELVASDSDSTTKQEGETKEAEDSQLDNRSQDESLEANDSNISTDEPQTSENQEDVPQSTVTEQPAESDSPPQETAPPVSHEETSEQNQSEQETSSETPQETSSESPQETSSESSQEPATTEAQVDTTEAPQSYVEEPTPVDDELSTVAPEIVPDEPAPEVGTFASWFQETAQLTDHDQPKDTVTEKPDENKEDLASAVESESPQMVYEEVTSTTEAYYQETEVPNQHAQEISRQEEQESIEATTESMPPQSVTELPESTSTSASEESSSSSPEIASNEQTHDHDHIHEHNHDHHHHHNHEPKQSDAETSSFILIVKHLSSTLLSFLPEHLQDTILDVDDALVFTGIIALTLVSICVPYFLIEGFFSVRPLKKKVVELNKSLWKVSTAYENQQEEFEIYKKKALAYDEDKKRVEQLEYELLLLKKLEAKQKEEVTRLRQELKTNARLADDVQSMIETTMERKNKAVDEKEKLKTTVTSLKEALRRTTDELQEAQAEGSAAVMDLELARQANETFTMKVDLLEREVGELKAKLITEVDRRRTAEDERDEVSKSKTVIENELTELKKICHKYEDTVSDLNNEIGHKENELAALKETLGEDSPLVDIAEVKARLVNAEEETTSLQSRVESMTLENNSLSRSLKESTTSLSTVQKERDEAFNRLQVLETYFKEKEEELRHAVDRYEAEKNIRGKGKDDLVRMIEEKSSENKELSERLEAFKDEFEETKQQHRNEIRALEAKSHENWLSLCQAERKAQDARKEAEFLRQKLTVLTKEKEEGGEELNGEVPMYPLLTPDMVPLPLPDDGPSYFGLGDGFMPPPPLPLDEREPHRPAPLGRLSPTSYSDVDDSMLSPIRRGPRDDDYSDGESSASDSPRRRRSPRGGWVDLQHDRDRERDRDRDRDRERDDRRRRGPPGPRTSSPIPSTGFNL